MVCWQTQRLESDLATTMNASSVALIPNITATQRLLPSRPCWTSFRAFEARFRSPIFYRVGRHWWRSQAESRRSSHRLKMTPIDFFGRAAKPLA